MESLKPASITKIKPKERKIHSSPPPPKEFQSRPTLGIQKHTNELLFLLSGTDSWQNKTKKKEWEKKHWDVKITKI